MPVVCVGLMAEANVHGQGFAVRSCLCSTAGGASMADWDVRRARCGDGLSPCFQPSLAWLRASSPGSLPGLGEYY